MSRPALEDEAYQALRLQVLDRDAWRCRNPLCRSARQLEVDHVIGRGQLGPDTLENLVTLCHTCHELKTLNVLLVIPDGNGGFRFHDLRRVLRCESCDREILLGERAAVPTPSGGTRWVTRSAGGHAT